MKVNGLELVAYSQKDGSITCIVKSTFEEALKLDTPSLLFTNEDGSIAMRDTNVKLQSIERKNDFDLKVTFVPRGDSRVSHLEEEIEDLKYTIGGVSAKNEENSKVAVSVLESISKLEKNIEKVKNTVNCYKKLTMSAIDSSIEATRLANTVNILANDTKYGLDDLNIFIDEASIDIDAYGYAIEDLAKAQSDDVYQQIDSISSAVEELALLVTRDSPE